MYRARLSAALAMLAVIAVPATAFAQAYPNRNITLVVGFAAGGIADGIGRLIGQKMSERLGQSVIVENRGGAGGNIAANVVSSAAADGYTILVTTTALAINETLYKKKSFVAADFRPLAIVASSPESFTTHPDNPGGNLSEFVAANKGKTINFGSAGVGSGSHIAAEYFFKVLAKVPATHVPFQGGAPAINAVVANHVSMLTGTLAGGVANQINSGKLKGLGVASDKRVPVTPQVPTFGEGGYPGFTAASWVGFFAPAGTPPEVVAKLNATIDGIVKDAEVDKRLKALGFDPVTGAQPQAESHFKAEVVGWGKMVSTLGLAVE